MDPKKYNERQDVLGLALDLHMWTTGSGPDLSDEDRDLALNYLRRRLSRWTSNGSYTELFDTAVRMLLIIAVNEAEERRKIVG